MAPSEIEILYVYIYTARNPIFCTDQCFTKTAYTKNKSKWQ